MIFRQFVDDDLGCASYLIGDENEGTAVVVDPAYAIEPYLDEAEHRQVKVTCVLETHTHADHLSGHGRLALEHGCTVHIHRAAEAEFAHERLVRELRVGCGMDVHCAAVIEGQSPVAREMVGVRVRFQHTHQLRLAVFSLLEVLLDRVRRVDDQRLTRGLISDQVGRAAEIVVDELPELHEIRA